MKTVYWFAPTFFIANNVESRRYTWQNKHLFENPWVGAHSVRTENHCLSTQRVRVWFAVLTIGGASPRAKDFHSNAHLSCVPAAFYVIGNKKCRSKPISSFHAGGGLYLSTAFFMWHIHYSRKGSSMYNKHSVGNFVHFVSIAGRLEALFERTQWASLPETCLIGGGAKWTKLPWMRLYMEEPFRTLLNNIPIIQERRIREILTVWLKY